jgi:hypothetical protein
VHWQDLVSPISRIVFGLIFLNKLWFCWEAHRIVWAHSRPLGGRGFHVLMALLMASAVLFTVGLFSGPATLVLFVLYLVLFRYASLFGLEDVAFQTLVFYFVFAGAGERLSLDAMLGTGVWGRFLGPGPFPEIALAGALGNIMLSAGTNKLASPMWQKGLGSYFFFLLPQFRRLDTRLVTGNRLLVRLTNHPAVVMELALLPAMLFNARPLGLVFWAMAIGFTILLFTVFVLTWIGEAMTMGLLMVLPLLLDTSHPGLWSMLSADLGATASPAVLAAKAFVLATLATGLWVACCVPELSARWGPALTAINTAMRYAARFTWGLVHLKVFTEIHMQGPVVFRTFLEPEAGPPREVFPIFTERCEPGPKRSFHPAFYEVLSYKVGEACMEIDACGRVEFEDRRLFLEELAGFIAAKYARPGEALRSVLFKVNQVIPPADFRGHAEDHLDRPWQDAFRIALRPGSAAVWSFCVGPILSAPTGRDPRRLSFKFNPKGY